LSFDGYKFITTNLLTGQILGDLEISSCNWKEVYKAPGSATITVRFDAPTSKAENFPEWSSGLWIVKDGDIQWGGIVGKVQRRGGTRSITIPAIGFLEYFRKRFLRNAQGMTYGQLLRVSDIEWRDVDVFHVFKDVVDHVQSFPDGDLNIGVTWDELSGKLTTMVYRTFTVKSVGNLMGELSDRLSSGFDFEQRYEWVNGRPKCNFHLMYPQFNRELNKMLVFQVDRDVIVDEPVLNALDTTGVSGSYATMGDVTSITGDIEITAYLRPNDWTPGTVKTIRSKWNPPSNKSWRFQILTDGKLRFQWTTNGSTELTEDSDLSVTFNNLTLGLVQVRMDVDNGAGNYSCTFWESLNDGVTWNSLDTAPADPFGNTFTNSF
jgi:hypothetical protein